MPLSEKTVELNLTTELLNWLWKVTGHTHCAFGLTQQQEAQLGVDVATVGGTSAIFIQYKRAYVEGSNWRWHLNRTTGQDQHQKLQQLEGIGLNVYYAFPYFDSGSELAANRRRLLLNTFWIRPSQIQPAGGPTGHHDVVFSSTTGVWVVHSDPVPLPVPLSIDDVASDLAKTLPQGAIERQIEGYNKVFSPAKTEEEGLILVVRL